MSRFRVMECSGCGQIYLDPLPGPQEIRALFQQLYASGSGSVPELGDYYTYCYEDEPGNPLVQQYEAWLIEVERIRPPGRVLDIGCGTGLFLSVARRRGWQPFGIDESVEATDWAREHFGLDPWVGEFEAFASGGERFDLISGWDVIEHSRDPVGLLQSARQCLSPRGVVALSTPNQRSILDLVAGCFYRATGGRFFAPLEKFYIEQHFLYFTPKSMEACLERAGLSIVSLRKELTDLRRLSLSAPMRLALQALFLASRPLGLQNRLFVLARAGSSG